MPFKKGLELRLLKAVAILTIGFALITSSYAFFLEYAHETEAAQQTQTQLVHAVMTQASIAAYAGNSNIADEVITGLLLHDYVIAVKITSQNGFVRLRQRNGVQWKSNADISNYQLHSPIANEEIIGNLELHTNQKLVEAKAVLAATKHSLFIIIQSIFLSTIIVLIFRLMFSKPIESLVHQLNHLEAGYKHHVQVDEAHANDELGSLARGINRLVDVSEDAIHQLTIQKNSAQKATRSKSRFLAAASHDLRQPMHALNMYLGVLSEYPLPSKAADVLSNARHCSKIMDDLFAAFLDISRLDAAAVIPIMTTFPIQSMFDQLAVELFPIADEKGLYLQFSPSTLIVSSDFDLLKNVLRNLVANAIRYTEKGGVLVGCRRTKTTIMISVYDTGIGVSEKEQEYIFEEFYQVENAERNRNHGLGLGLAIVHRLAKLLGIEIRLVSQLGRGSMFGIILPRAFEKTDQGEIYQSSFGNYDILFNTLIVVVDDDHEIQQSTRAVLERVGCEVICAGSVQEIMGKLEKIDRVPDVLVCDYRLPGKTTGIELIHQIREKFSSDIPALLITGDTKVSRLETSIKQNFFLLHKPLQPDMLRRALVDAIKRM